MSTGDSLLDKDDPQQIRKLFNRSPHPYHRPSFENAERLTLKSPDVSDGLHARESARHLSRQSSITPSIRSPSPSDSGTEADDEKPLLKAITAPPLRPRKGLKSWSSHEGFSSPPSTPSVFGEEKASLFAGHALFERQRARVLRTNTQDHIIRLPRKGIEARRRLFETVLFFTVAWLSLRATGRELQNVFWYHTASIALVYAQRVCVILANVYIRSRSRRQGFKIWFPASADPAPLLYPVFMPLLATHSLGTSRLDLLSSYILSFCAIPREVVWFQDYYVQWLLSLSPLLFSAERSWSLDLNREEIVLLFPLHCALMHTLYFLTTSSLLEPELQLLSLALINLLGVPKTPQLSVLKALLWVGGLCLLISCRHILKLSVELARIPKWRLRKVRRPRNDYSTLFCALDDMLGGFLTRHVFSSWHDASSEEDVSLQERSTSRSKRTGWKQSSQARSEINQRTSVDDLQFTKEGSPSIVAHAMSPIGIKQRRHTLSGSLTTLPDIPTLTRTATDVLSSARKRSRLVMRLTLPQAAVLKWLYAAFVYLMTVTIILGPVRLYVQYFALHGQEPVGWALGYLFGDYQPFRMQVVMLNLDSWIPLSPRSYEPNPRLGYAERLQQEVLGVANTRLAICAYCVAWIVVGLVVVFRLSSVVEVDTRRKVFHGMMVAMFLPTIYVDPAFIALAFALILAIFLLLDLFRASQLPPLSKPLTYFLAPYVDGRDHKGPIVISHIFLLIGCAIPLWLSLATIEGDGSGPFVGWNLPTRNLSMVTGVICVGMGDAAASLIGRRYGRRRWPWSGGKSLEGSAAFAFAVILGLLVSRAWLVLGGWNGNSNDPFMTSVGKSAVAAVGASLTEAVLTGGNDNVVVPVILWLLSRGLKM